MKNDSAPGQNPGLKVLIPCTGLTLTMKSSCNTRTDKNLQGNYAGDFTLFGKVRGEEERGPVFGAKKTDQYFKTVVHRRQRNYRVA